MLHVCLRNEFLIKSFNIIIVIILRLISSQTVVVHFMSKTSNSAIYEIWRALNSLSSLIMHNDNWRILRKRQNFSIMMHASTETSVIFSYTSTKQWEAEFIISLENANVIKIETIERSKAWNCEN